uniref:Uncharacterized protein n=1 Tax=viral metagenome TaxID=1070528 RepID=A0A6C0AY56_9ZZZZ
MIYKKNFVYLTLLGGAIDESIIKKIDLEK